MGKIADKFAILSSKPAAAEFGKMLITAEAALVEKTAELESARAARSAVDLAIADDDLLDRLDAGVTDAQRAEDRARERRDAISHRHGEALKAEAAQDRAKRRDAAIAERDRLVLEAPKRWKHAVEAIRGLLSDLAADTIRIEEINRDASADDRLRNAEEIWRNRPGQAEELVSEQIVSAWVYSRNGQRITDEARLRAIVDLGDGKGLIESDKIAVHQREFLRREVLSGIPPTWNTLLAVECKLADTDGLGWTAVGDNPKVILEALAKPPKPAPKEPDRVRRVEFSLLEETR